MSQFQQIKLEAKTLFDSGEFTHACTMFKQAHALDENDLNVLMGLGLCYANLHDSDNTKYWLVMAEEKADKQHSHLPAIAYFHLAKIYHQNNEQDIAIDYYQTAIAYHSEFPMAHLLLASLYMARKELDDAEYHYRYTIKLQPENADAYANLAQVYELLNQTESAHAAIDKALDIKNDHIGALLALAKLEKREKKYFDAEQTLNRIIENTVQPAVKAMAYIELGHVLDKQKRYDEAFEISTRGKGLWSDEAQNLPFDKNEYQKKINSNKNFFVHKSAEVVKPNVSKKYRAPVFFVGFPRSGTTLVEQILNQHPNIMTSDEKAFIDTVKESIPSVIHSQTTYPECLNV